MSLDDRRNVDPSSGPGPQPPGSWDLPPPDPDFFSLDAELAVNKRLNMEDIRALDRFAREKGLPKNTGPQLVKFLHSCDYNVNLAQKCMESFYCCRLRSPELFTGRDVRRPDLKTCLDHIINLAVLPRRTPDNCRILYSGLQTADTHKYVFADVCKLVAMTMDSIFLTEPTVRGIIFVYDLSVASLGHFFKFGFFVPRKLTAYFQTGLPLRQEGTHLYNCSSFIDRAMKVLHTFASKKDIERTIVHGQNDNSIFEYIPKECLPSDCGGTLPSIKELHKMNTARLDALRNYFIQEEECLAKN